MQRVTDNALLVRLKMKGSVICLQHEKELKGQVQSV